MRVVAALGGNALLERGETPDADLQEHHVVQAVEALAPLAGAHQLVLTHGNGPQVGVLALESARDPVLTHPYPFDVLGAQTQGMIGYWLLQALGNALPGADVAALICRTKVDAADPAFGAPTKFVGAVYPEHEAHRLATERGWAVAKDGERWRRVVASPEPVELVELATIARLVEAGTIVVCSGGGGIPVVETAAGTLEGVEAVIDKDLAAAALAVALGADRLLLLTDVDAVQLGYGTATACAVRDTTVAELRAQHFAAGSMGPKVEAACRFVEATGNLAAIGRLADAADLLAGRAGTVVAP